MHQSRSYLQLLVLICLCQLLRGFSVDNTCTFHVRNSVFSLASLSQWEPYKLQHDSQENQWVLFNFCTPFIPSQCPSAKSAYSFLITRTPIIYNNEIVDADDIEQVAQEDESASITEDDEIDYDEYLDNDDMTEDEDMDDDQYLDDDEITDSNESQEGQANENQTRLLTQEEQSDSSEHNEEGQPDYRPKYQFQCTPYSSNEHSGMFSTAYFNKTLIFRLYSSRAHEKTTQFQIQSSESYDFEVQDFEVREDIIIIKGSSAYGIPMIQMERIWSVIHDNLIFVGLILVIVGGYMLFYGRATIEAAVFLSSFFIIFGILGAIATIFISANSSSFAVYFSFLIILFLSTLFAYFITKIIDYSIFFVGAFLGLIIAVLVNSLFASIFEVYSIWSLVAFSIIFGIPLGLLTFKFADHIIIISTSLSGAYMVVRPISWIFGGFPNQFHLYRYFENGELEKLPWSFYLYLIAIIALAIIGAMYQFLKLNRQTSEEDGSQIEVNFIQQKLEQPMDHIKGKIDGFIEKYRSRENSEDSRNMEELNNKGTYYKLDEVRNRKDSNEWVQKQNYSSWKEDPNPKKQGK